jgi:hypothetical protein
MATEMAGATLPPHTPLAGAMASGYRAIRADNREQATCFCGLLGHAETRGTAMFDHNTDYPTAVAGSRSSSVSAALRWIRGWKDHG